MQSSMWHNRAGENASRAETLDLLGGGNEVAAMRSFVKITLDDEDLVAGSIGAAGFTKCKKVPKNGKVSAGFPL